MLGRTAIVLAPPAIVLPGTKSEVCSPVHMQSGTDLPSLRRATSEESNLGANGTVTSAVSANSDLTAPLRTWGRFRLVNGLAIWREGSTAEHPGTDEAYSSTGTVAAAAARARAVMERAGAPQLDSFMVSHRIRGSPRQVRLHLCLPHA